MKKYLFIVLAVALALGAYLQSNVQKTSALAADSDNSVITLNCTAATAVGMVPDIGYAVSWSTADETAEPTCTAVATLANGADEGIVENDANPTGEDCQLVGSTGSFAGWIQIDHAMPFMKMAGLQCQTSSDQLSIDASNTSANADLAVFIAPSNVNATLFDYAVTLIDGATNKMIYGTSGLVTVAKPTDGGAGDADTLTNGEILVTTFSTPYIGVAADVTNGNPNTHTETITFQFTVD